jgi:hypothetical protein
VTLGLKWQALDLFGPIEKHLKINQKSVKYTPLTKIKAAFLNILSGSTTMFEINKNVRAEQMVYEAFGLEGCPEQSVVQQTLDRGTSENVEQAYTAFTQIYRHFSRGYHHNYEQALQVLDIDFTGTPCGRKAALATKGYFAKTRNRRGRQVGRVVATNYQEIVVDRLYAGNVQLNTELKALLGQAERILELSPAKRKKTVVRVDSGGGSVENINYLLEQGYLYHGKDYASQVNRRSRQMQSVKEWIVDPRHEGREVGWLMEEPPYSQPVRRVAVRCPRANGQWAYGVVVSSLSKLQLIELLGWDTKAQYDERQVALGMVYFYDQRGGGVETEIKEDKQALGLGKRNKKRFEGQQMLTILGAVAHNVLVWSRAMLEAGQTKSKASQGFGLYRITRDLLTMNGLIWLNASGQITQIVLNHLDPYAKLWLTGFDYLLSATQVGVILGKT